VAYGRYIAEHLRERDALVGTNLFETHSVIVSPALHQATEL
jgi:hypothetical protein